MSLHLNEAIWRAARSRRNRLIDRIGETRGWVRGPRHDSRSCGGTRRASCQQAVTNNMWWRGMEHCLGRMDRRTYRHQWRHHGRAGRSPRKRAGTTRASRRAIAKAAEVQPMRHRPDRGRHVHADYVSRAPAALLTRTWALPTAAPPSTCRRCAPASPYALATAGRSSSRSGSRKRAGGGAGWSRPAATGRWRHLRALWRRRRRAVVLRAKASGRASSPRPCVPTAATTPSWPCPVRSTAAGGQRPLLHGRAGRLQVRGQVLADVAWVMGAAGLGIDATSMADSPPRPTSASSRPRASASACRPKVITTVGQHGNTSAASIPRGPRPAVRDRRIQQEPQDSPRRGSAAAPPGVPRCSKF